MGIDLRAKRELGAGHLVLARIHWKNAGEAALAECHRACGREIKQRAGARRVRFKSRVSDSSVVCQKPDAAIERYRSKTFDNARLIDILAGDRDVPFGTFYHPEVGGSSRIGSGGGSRIGHGSHIDIQSTNRGIVARMGHDSHFESRCQDRLAGGSGNSACVSHVRSGKKHPPAVAVIADRTAYFRAGLHCDVTRFSGEVHSRK